MVEHGFCECGCGEKTPISPVSCASRELVRGKPLRFIHGHNQRIRPLIEEAVPFKINGVYCRLIPLTRGHYAIVDEVDYAWLMQYKWRAQKVPHGYYAMWAYLAPDGKIKHVAMHKLIHPASPGKTTDHKSRCPLDNRRKNLRDASRQQQNWNKSGWKKGNKAGYKGVSRERSWWLASIRINGKRIRLGQFKDADLIEAARAYDRAAHEYFGEFACVNFPDEVNPMV